SPSRSRSSAARPCYPAGTGPLGWCEAILFRSEAPPPIIRPTIASDRNRHRRGRLILRQDAGFLPVYATLHTVFEPSSVTINEPSLATATPTGRPQTSPSGVTKPTRKSSYSPVAFPSFIGTRITLYPVRRARFHEPCSEAKMSFRYARGNCSPS